MKKKEHIKEKEYGEENNDADVFVMNEEVRSHHHEQNENTTWGVLFIFAGIILLLNTFGIIPWEIWETLLHFWPVLIIIAGVQMILGGSRIARILSRLITLALIGWVVLIALNQVTPEFIQKLPHVFKQPIKWWEVIQE